MDPNTQVAWMSPKRDKEQGYRILQIQVGYGKLSPFCQINTSLMTGQDSYLLAPEEHTVWPSC